MVWNTLMWGPLMNGTVILYDGHPAYPDAGKLLQHRAFKPNASKSVALEDFSRAADGHTIFDSGEGDGRPIGRVVA